MDIWSAVDHDVTDLFYVHLMSVYPTQALSQLVKPWSSIFELAILAHNTGNPVQQIHEFVTHKH